MTWPKKPFVYCLHADEWADRAEVYAQLKGAIDVAAIAVDLYMAEGPIIMQEFRETMPGLPLYAHFLYYDVAEMVIGAATGLVKHGVDALDVHALCGAEVLKGVSEAVARFAQTSGRSRPSVIACALLPTQVDMLPWLGPDEKTKPEEVVRSLAGEAIAAGVDGLLLPEKFVTGVGVEYLPRHVVLSYATAKGAQETLETGVGLFFDPHWEEQWRRTAGKKLIRELARRKQ